MRMCLELSVALLLYNLIYRFEKHPYFGQNSYVELEECRPKLFSVILPQIHGFGCKKNCKKVILDLQYIALAYEVTDL